MAECLVNSWTADNRQDYLWNILREYMDNPYASFIGQKDRFFRLKYGNATMILIRKSEFWLLIGAANDSVDSVDVIDTKNGTIHLEWDNYKEHMSEPEVYATSRLLVSNVSGKLLSRPDMWQFIGKPLQTEPRPFDELLEKIKNGDFFKG